MKPRAKKTFSIFWQQVKKYPKVTFGIVFSVTAASAINIIVPVFYKKFFDILGGGVPTAETAGTLMAIVLKVLFFSFISWIFWRISTFSASYFQTKSMADIGTMCFGYIHRHSTSFFNNNFVGALVKKINRFSGAFEGMTDSFFWDVWPNIINLTLIIYILSSKSRYLGLGIVAWVIVYCAVNYFFSLYKIKHDIKRSEADSKVTGLLADTIANHSNVKLFNGYGRELKTFAQAVENLRKLRLFSWNLGNIFEAVQGFLMIALEFGVFYFAIRLWQQGRLTIGDFVLIQSYIFTIFDRLWNFGRVIRRFYEYMADASEMTEVLELPHEIINSKDAKDLVVTSGRIEFKEVMFSYRKTRRIFSDLYLSISPKEKVAIVGPSGSGKTTLIKLLLREMDLEYGKILIDGQKVAKVTLESLWQNISLVNQDPILFHRTLMENIRYGRPDATDEEVIDAACLANCHEFIKDFPEGYGTFVGERGVKLSGGERQRVAIARAILKNAPILVMDEATSSLDSQSEQFIQTALDELMKNKTVIVIAHRLSTIMKMDRIVVLDKGRIVEEGPHTILTGKKVGLYKNLWEKQVSGFIK